MQIAELREKSVVELNAQLLDLLRDQFNFRMQKTTGQLKQTHLLKQVKRDIARIKSMLSERAGK